MRVLVAMSGGVDSSVAAAMMLEAGHDVVGATMKLWGGASDSGCCSVADTEDARTVADQLGFTHRVFNFASEFEDRVVAPYVAAHAAGTTPNPCIECNRHLKFDRLLERAWRLGFDAVATGHHARVTRDRDGWHLGRGADGAKDQSYVLSMLKQDQLSRCLFPVGELTKIEVRARARSLGLRTAAKPDSQDVCFITASAGRAAFVGGRIDLHPGQMIDGLSGAPVGSVDAVELVTVGQRRGVGTGPDGQRRYVLDVDVASRTVMVGPESALMASTVGLVQLGWVNRVPNDGSAVLAQTSAHGPSLEARLDGSALTFERPQRRVAPGQTVALYGPDGRGGEEVLGAGIASV